MTILYDHQVLSSLKWTVRNDEMQKKAYPSLTNGTTNLKMIIPFVTAVMENVLEEKREKLNLNHLQRLNIQDIMDAKPRVTLCVYLSKDVKQYVVKYVDF